MCLFLFQHDIPFHSCITDDVVIANVISAAHSAGIERKRERERVVEREKEKEL
jgi:hypothetical protein